MTEPTNAPAPPPAQSQAPATAPAPSQLSGMLASMSQAELMIGAGALLILLTDLVFVLFGPYSFSQVIWAAAATSLVLVLTHGRVAMMSWVGSNYQTLLSLGILVAVLMAIRELLRDLLFIPGRSLDSMFLLGMVGLYVGVAVMAFGGWQLWKGRAA